ncbi:sensor histidine kinase [Rhodanobacter umsongensis]|uniref:Sensor histidine kinase n=1 Tax=Rhodanobacter umsongensis TaxID=633153 RepID=A0ABW0JKP2_9GAMM
MGREMSIPSGAPKALPPLRLILLIGWSPIVLGSAIAAMTVLSHPDRMLAHVFFVLICVLPSIPLGLVQRSLWQRRASWKVSVIVLLALSFLMALGSASVGILLMTQFAGLPGGFQWRSVLGSMDVVWFVLLAFCAMHMVIGYYVSMKEESERALAAVALTRDAELRALRYQLHPHFLFNTLNAISTMVVEQRTRDATRMIARLGDFLRATLEGDGPHEVTLADELSLTEHYLDIERARLGDRLAIRMQVGPDTLRAAVPYLLLQPLVENAIRHGIAARGEGGRLDIQASHVAGRLHIGVRNDGVDPAAGQPSANPTDSSSLGLRNVRERLLRLYEGDHEFGLTLAGDGTCQVLIDLPFRRMPAPAIEPSAVSA